MGDEEAFLKAIADAAHDAAPRLVYADWLDEHGDPDRAEYVRLVCCNDEATLARLRELAPSLDPAWVARVCRDYPRVHPMYVVIRLIARGAMTTVYEAAHTHPSVRGRPLAIRILNERWDSPQFLRGCQIHAALEHERIPPIYDVGEFDGRPYAVRMFIDGDDLLNNIRGRAVLPADLVRIVTTIASVLDVMHARQIDHGCVHPRHVLRDQAGSVWLIGFGELVPPARGIGPPLHLAPEQLEQYPRPVQRRTDVYQLAETAAWLLAGRHPFQDWRRPEELLAAKRSDDGWRTGPFRNLPGRVAAAFGRALAPGPADRYASAGEFAAALAAAFEPRSRWRFW